MALAKTWPAAMKTSAEVYWVVIKKEKSEIKFLSLPVTGTQEMRGCRSDNAAKIRLPVLVLYIRCSGTETSRVTESISEDV